MFFGLVQLYNRLYAKSGRIAMLVWRKENMFHTFLLLTLRRIMRAAIDVTLCLQKKPQLLRRQLFQLL